MRHASTSRKRFRYGTTLLVKPIYSVPWISYYNQISAAIRAMNTRNFGVRQMSSGFGRWGAGAGIVFAVLFVAGVILGPANLPSGSDAEVVAFYASSGNRLQLIISAYAFTAAAFFYVVFLIDLRSRIQRSTSNVANWLGLSAITGALFLAMMIAAGAAIASIAGNMAFGGDPQPAVADVARDVPELGLALLLIGSMVLAAAHLASTSIAALRSHVLPPWLCIAGLVAAIILLPSVLFLPMVVLPLWVGAVGVVLLLRSGMSPGAS
jgi:hypothetical protein